jgi:predicted small secreted protein
VLIRRAVVFIATLLFAATLVAGCNSVEDPGKPKYGGDATPGTSGQGGAGIPNKDGKGRIAPPGV